MNALGDPAEHARLLAARARLVAATWRRVRREVAGDTASWWSDDERALLELPEARTTRAPEVALSFELDELCALQRRFDQHRAGDPEALDDLVDHFLDSEHVQKLMPEGRLPAKRDLAIARLLGEMKGELLGRLVLQVALESPRAPSRPGEVAFPLCPKPSWGQGTHALLLGRARALLVGAAPLPPRYRFAWNEQGYRLAAPRLRIEGTWQSPGAWSIRAPGREAQLVPRLGEWPLLPPIVDEDGAARSRRRYPPPGAPDYAAAIFSAAATQSERIEKALAVLRAAWPEGARTVEDFTRALIPVTQPELVSYSFAPAPGWSYLNLYDRDFVDLVDDLVHENAHHHLNYILAREALLAPPSGGDDGLVYYSPWREALRPLRGIFHAVFTFTAGAELFAHLWRALDRGVLLPHRFTAAERRKIAARCLEETLQVRYSLVDLAHAWRAGRVTEKGHALALELGRRNRGHERLAPSLRAAIAGTREERRLDALAATLEKQSALRQRYAARTRRTKG